MSPLVKRTTVRSAPATSISAAGLSCLTGPPSASGATVAPEQPAAHDLLTAFLVGQPTAVAALLVDHADDGTGKCRTCGGRAIGDRVPWPCTLHTAAHLAASKARVEKAGR
jgi:hypothetical protein